MYKLLVLFRVSAAGLVLSIVGGFARSTRPRWVHGDSADPLPSPPRVIPDWRRFGQGHPKSSQIGVDFRHQASIGVALAGFDFPISAIACDVGDHGDSIPSPRLRELGFSG